MGAHHATRNAPLWKPGPAPAENMAPAAPPRRFAASLCDPQPTLCAQWPRLRIETDGGGKITCTALVQVAQGPAAALQEFIGNWQTARPLRLQSANKPEHPQSTGNHRRDGGPRCRRDASRTGETEGTQPDDMQRLPN